MPDEIKGLFSAKRARVKFARLYNEYLHALKRGEKSIPISRMITFISTCGTWAPHECVSMCKAFLIAFKEVAEDESSIREEWKKVYDACVKKTARNANLKRR